MGRTRQHSSITTFAVALIAVTMIACGGGGSEPTSNGNPPGNSPDPTPPPGTPTPPVSAANVSISSTGDGYGGRSRSFVPPNVSVTTAGTVTWTNPTDEVHNITFAGEAPSATLQTGQSHQETFPTAGSFPFSCTLHAGMNGTVTVVQ